MQTINEQHVSRGARLAAFIGNHLIFLKGKAISGLTRPPGLSLVAAVLYFSKLKWFT